MKNLILITTTLFLLVLTTGFSQTNTESIPSNQDASIKKENAKAEIDNKEFFKGFIGTYVLEEADFELEIVVENNNLYIVTSFSKDILVPKSNTLLHELIRGVDLELIKDNPNALKFTQNGYETTIKRVEKKETK